MSQRWPNSVTVPRITKGAEPAKVTASAGLQEIDAGGVAGVTLPFVPPPLLGSTAMFMEPAPKLTTPPTKSSVNCEKAGTEAQSKIVTANKDLITISFQE